MLDWTGLPQNVRVAGTFLGASAGTFLGAALDRQKLMTGSLLLTFIELQPNVLLYFKIIYMVTNRW